MFVWLIKEKWLSKKNNKIPTPQKKELGKKKEKKGPD